MCHVVLSALTDLTHFYISRERVRKFEQEYSQRKRVGGSYYLTQLMFDFGFPSRIDISDEFSFTHMLEFSKLAVAIAVELGGWTDSNN